MYFKAFKNLRDSAYWQIQILRLLSFSSVYQISSSVLWHPSGLPSSYFFSACSIFDLSVLHCLGYLSVRLSWLSLFFTVLAISPLHCLCYLFAPLSWLSLCSIVLVILLLHCLSCYCSTTSLVHCLDCLFSSSTIPFSGCVIASLSWLSLCYTLLTISEFHMLS